MSHISSDNITTESDLREYYTSVGFTPNLPTSTTSALYLVVSAPLIALVLSVWAWEAGLQSFLIRPPYNIVFAANILLVLLAPYRFEDRFIDVLVDIRDVFEVPDSTYYRFFGAMFGAMYLVSPFRQDSADARIYGFNRMLFITVAVANTLAIYFVGIVPQPLDFSLISAVYLSYLLLVTAVCTLGGYFLIWMALIFSYFFGYRIQEFDVRLDVTKSPENLGLESYGIFIIKVLSYPFVALLIIGWTGFVNPNEYIFLLTGIGTIAIPIAFVGSQYGLHVAILRAKTERLQELRDSYSREIDVYFSPSTPDANTNHEDGIRANAMLSVKNEIENLPEWPANVNRIRQVGVGLLLPNLPGIMSVLNIGF